MIVKITSKRQVTFRHGCWMRQAWVPAINSNWKKVPAASFWDPDTSIVPASEHCAVRSQADIHHSTSRPSGTDRMIRRYGIDELPEELQRR